MINIKKHITLTVLLGLIAQAAVMPLAKAAEAEDAIVINPKTLRSHMLRSNIGIIQEMQNIQLAKDNMFKARMALLPGVNFNISSLIGGAGAGSFLLSSVTLLLPFLLPTNWFSLGKNEALLDAEKLTFYLLELNTYASVYSAYSGYLSDVALRDVAQKQYDNYKKIRVAIETENFVTGKAREEDLVNALGNEQQAFGNLSLTNELLVKDVSYLRQYMGELNVDQKYNFIPSHVATTPAEKLSLEDLAEQANEKAPEVTQLAYLIQGAQYDKWTAYFSFLTGNTLAANPTSNGTSSSVTALNSFTQSNSFTASFGYFANIRIAGDNIKQLENTKTQIKLAENQISESSLGSLKEALTQVKENTKAEANLEKVYLTELNKYKYLGLSDLYHVYQAYNLYITASIARVKAQQDLDLQRINLHRVLITGEFEVIPGCALTAQAKAQFEKSWIDKIFGGNDDNLGVDGICKPDLAE